MPQPSSLTRRALVAATTAAAAAPAAPVAAAKKKKGKKKPPRPLAYAVVLEAENRGGGQGKLFLNAAVAFYHPGSVRGGAFRLDLEVAFARLDADLTAQVRNAVVGQLSGAGISVPADRIAVTVL